jgi:uncharacterized membrane protein YhaH (DUF805 family)
MDQMQRLFFSTAGRIHRQDFWTGALSVVLVLVIAFVTVARTVGPVYTGQLILFVIELLLAYPLYAVMAKRFQDRGRPGVYAIAAIAIPLVISLLALLGVVGREAEPTLIDQVLQYLDLVVLIWILLDLGLAPGTPGTNQFGPDPLANG